MFMATPEELQGLVSIVFELGLHPQIRTVLGADNEAFDALLVETNPQKAYAIARNAGDQALARKAAEAVIRQRVGGTSLEGAVLGVYAPPVQPEDAPIQAGSAGFSIKSLADRHMVHGVSYQGEICTVDISKALLDNGASHVQSDWIEMTRQGEWKVPSGSLYLAVLVALYDNKNADNVGEVKKMLAKDFKEYFMMTSTRVRYSANGLDTVVHDFGYATERAEQMDVVGSDGYVNGTSGFGVEMRALVGIDDCQKIEQVGRWITGKKPYLYRFNSKPREDVERALVLGVNVGGRFIISASDYVDFRRARGMVARRAENSP